MKFSMREKLKPNYEGKSVIRQKIVDPLGFIPHKQKIDNYIQAGIRLQKSRIEQYDADSSVKPEDILKNPYRDRGMDFSDVARSKKMLDERIKTNIKRQKEALERERIREEFLAKNRVREGENLPEIQSEKGSRRRAEPKIEE